MYVYMNKDHKFLTNEMKTSMLIQSLLYNFITTVSLVYILWLVITNINEFFCNTIMTQLSEKIKIPDSQRWLQNV